MKEKDVFDTLGGHKPEEQPLDIECPISRNEKKRNEDRDETEFTMTLKNESSAGTWKFSTRYGNEDQKSRDTVSCVALALADFFRRHHK